MLFSLPKKDPSCCICLRDEEECAAVGTSLGKCLKSQLPLCSRCSKEIIANSAHSEAERELMAQIPSAERRSALLLPMRIAAKKKSDPQLWEHIRWVRNSNFKTHFPLFFCFCVGMWHAAINYPFSPRSRRDSCSRLLRWKCHRNGTNGRERNSFRVLERKK